LAKNIVIQRMGQTMKEGTIVKWLKKDGEKVVKGEPLYDLEYDKDAVTVESPDEGILNIVVKEGETLPVSTTIARILSRNETAVASADVPEKKPAVSRKDDADAIVIGAGPGGYVAAIKLALLGKKTVLVEKDKVGGICLNEGCIPTKALLMSAETLDIVKNSAGMGIGVTGYRIQPEVINKRKNQVVDTLVNGVKYLLKKRGVETIVGAASFTGPRTLRIELADGREKELSAEHIIIAAGSRSAKIPIEGIDGNNVVFSTEVLDVTALPKSMVVIGGGVIGMEIGSIYADFGVKITILEALPNILPCMDEEVSKTFRGIVERKMSVCTDAKVIRISDVKAQKKITYMYNGKQCEEIADKVLVAVGRSPETESLNLDAAGIKTERGWICVDDGHMTNVEGVYAIGDVNGEVLLAHAASAQGIAVAEKIAGHASSMNLKIVPNCIYTKPEIAAVGMTEKQAKEKGIAYKVGKFPFQANGKALAMGEPEGFVKIIADEKYGEILGVHIIGPRATDMISEAALAMRLECTASELAGTIHAHPTLTEAVMEAAESILGEAIHQ